MKTKIVLNPKYKTLEKTIEEIPSLFSKSGSCIYEGRNTIKVFDVDGYKINVKAFKRPNAINKFVYGNFRPSKAKRSFEYATILLEKQINTPEPIAYVEERNGVIFSNSYYICIHEQFDGMMREFQKGKLEGRESLLDQFALFTANMHNQKVLHLDYSPGNILYKAEDSKYSFYLVDLNRMYFGDVSIEQGCKNFCRLWGNNEMITYIAKQYAKYRGFESQKCIELTLKYHTRFWIKFTKRHKAKRAYIDTLQ